MLNTNHPVHEVLKFIKDLPETHHIELTFSKYIYVEYGKTLSRKILQISREEIDYSWIEHHISTLLAEEEIAIHSTIIINGLLHHIPFMDFVGEQNPENTLTAIAPLVTLTGVKPILYNSGRSLHAYFLTLLTDTQWRDFLAQAILVNPPSHKNINFTDSRWIAHSLLNGYSALRWSLNTKTYTSLPTKL